MPINLQPAWEGLPAYRPIEFEVFSYAVDGLYIVENALVTIFKNGVAIGPAIRYKSYRNQPSAFPGATDYFFKVDIQKYCQDLLAPNVEIPSSMFEGSPPVVNTDLYAEFYIEVEYELINLTTGLLELSPALTETSNTYYVFAASRTHLEPMNLEDYYGNASLIDTKWLTKGPRIVDLCEDEQALLSVIQPNAPAMNGYEVRLYDSNNVLLSRGLAQTGATALLQEYTINTSVAALTAETWIDGTPNFSDPNLSYYTITAGYYIIIAGPTYVYIEQTYAQQYNIKPSCCGLRSLRLHWLNLLGGVDSYTFNSEKDLELTTVSDRSQKALNWVTGSTSPHSTTDVGYFKIKSEASQTIALKSRILTNDEATWLSELLSSPKVYAEIDGFAFVPVIVEDTGQSIKRHQGKIQFEINVRLSNDWIVQRV